MGRMGCLPSSILKMAKLKTIIPDFYSRLLPKEVLHFDVTEKKATCHQCIMSRPQFRGKYPYRSELKCCTFYPFFPNYLVGATLSDSSLESAHQVIREKIKSREFALPIGLVAPLGYQYQFQNRKPEDFGQREDLLCPFYDQSLQSCMQWMNRGVVCTSFYCKSDTGKTGLQFWHQLSDYLANVEMALMEEALVYLDFSPRRVNEMTDFLNRQEFNKRETRQWKITEEKFQYFWNAYKDPIEFYKKSYQIVTEFDRKHLKEVLGQVEVELLEKLCQAYDQKQAMS